MTQQQLLEKIRSVNERLDTIDKDQQSGRREMTKLKNELLACYKEAINLRLKKHG